MNKGFRIAGIVVAVIILTVSIGFFVFNSKNKNPQNTPYEQAMNDNKPFVMMFHSDWCTYCQKVMPLFQQLSGEYSDKYNFVLLNVDDKSQEYVMKDFMPATIPQMYIVDPTVDARIMINSVLFNYPNKLRGELNRYLHLRAMIKM